MILNTGNAVYELEFTAGGYEYDYDIDAKTGEVLKSQMEKDDGVYDDDNQNRLIPPPLPLLPVLPRLLKTDIFP